MNYVSCDVVFNDIIYFKYNPAVRSNISSKLIFASCV